MGTYTPHFELYKPDPGDVVDCEVQINRQWDILDRLLKPLMEWEYTTSKLPTTKQGPNAEGFRSYSGYDNTLQMVRNEKYAQDSRIKQIGWTDASSFLRNGWTVHTGIWYRVVQPSFQDEQGWIEWCGTIKKLGVIPAVNNQIVMQLPVGHPTVPSRLCYFTCPGQDASGTFDLYSFNRVQMSTSRNVNLSRMGGTTPDDTSFSYCDFAGVRYDSSLGA